MNVKTATRVPSPEIVQDDNLPATVETPAKINRPPATITTPPQMSAPNIAKGIVGVMRDIGVVAKTGTNEHFKYSFARMEDITKRLTPLLAKHGIAIIPSEVSRSFVDPSYISITYAFTIMHESGEVWPERPEYTGVSLAKSRNGVFDDKCANKCSTAARKYFLLALFQIPTGEDDDADQGGNDAPPPKQSRVPSPPQEPTQAGRYMEPHAFKAATTADWAGKMLDYIAAAKTAAEVIQWDEFNRDNLQLLAKKDPARLKTVMAAMKDRKTELTPKEVPAETVTKDGEVVSPKPKAEVIPDADADPEKFLAWADKAMATAKTLEELEAKYNGGIEIHAEGLFPPDREELLGIFQRHERRFEP